MNTRLLMRISGVVGAGLLFFVGGAAGQVPGGSVTVENLTPLADVIGRRLPGEWGDPDAVRVEIRQTNPSGGISPPNPENGEGDPSNPLQRESHMGAGIIMETNPGRFSETFEGRLGGGSFFVRVFDRPAAGESLYYLDSSTFQDNGEVSAIHPSFAGSVWKLIETGLVDVDSDGDGIPDSLELDMGLDPFNRDTDGDGWDDLFEVLYSDYLNPLEPDPPLAILIHHPVEDYEAGPASPEDRFSVSWWTFPGPLYVLEFHPDQVDAPDDPETGYIEVWSGTSPGPEQVIGVDDILDVSPTGFFRVKAIAQ